VEVNYVAHMIRLIDYPNMPADGYVTLMFGRFV